MRSDQFRKVPFLFSLEGYPQPKTTAFWSNGKFVQNGTVPQVAPYEQLTTENFAPDFFLT